MIDVALAKINSFASDAKVDSVPPNDPIFEIPFSERRESWLGAGGYRH